MPSLNYVIVFVSDMDRSIAFYRDVLGFPVKHQSPKWSEFGTEGITLALHLGESILLPLHPLPVVFRLSVLVEQKQAIIRQFQDRFVNVVAHRAEDHFDLGFWFAADGLLLQVTFFDRPLHIELQARSGKCRLPAAQFHNHRAGAVLIERHRPLPLVFVFPSAEEKAAMAGIWIGGLRLAHLLGELLRGRFIPKDKTGQAAYQNDRHGSQDQPAAA